MKSLFLSAVVTCLALLSASLVSAATLNSQQRQDSNSQISAFRKLIQVDNLAIKVPTVIEVPIQETHLERNDAAVLDMLSGELQPYLFKEESLANQIPLTATIQSGASNIGESSALLDNNPGTFASFELPQFAQGVAMIGLHSAQPVTASSLAFLLDEHVAMPSSIEIHAVVNGQDTIVLAKEAPTSETVLFPRTISSSWLLTFTFAQPLRISELHLYQENAVQTQANAVRFLAQPGHTYRLYYDADRAVSENLPESGNLAMNTDVKRLNSSPAILNPAYIIADSDGDGVPDIRDNCVTLANPDQVDVNGNGIGDVCEDFDKDGISNFRDNCPNIPNVDQSDVDGDGIGDACDTQESRITEANPWIPWAGIGFAAVVILGLFAITLRTKPADAQQDV
jgi:hypothetical protein